MIKKGELNPLLVNKVKNEFNEVLNKQDNDKNKKKVDNKKIENKKRSKKTKTIGRRRENKKRG